MLDIYIIIIKNKNQTIYLDKLFNIYHYKFIIYKKIEIIEFFCFFLKNIEIVIIIDTKYLKINKIYN